MRWSQLRKQLKERVAASVVDSLDFNQTHYRHSHDQEGEFWITFQKDKVFSAGSLTYLVELGKLTTAAHERGATWAQAYDEAFPVMDASGLMLLEKINKDLKNSLSLTVEDMLEHGNPIIRALAVVDTRFGKRRLATFNAVDEHSLVQQLFELRCRAEGVTPVFESSKGAWNV